MTSIPAFVDPLVQANVEILYTSSIVAGLAVSLSSPERLISKWQLITVYIAVFVMHVEPSEFMTQFCGYFNLNCEVYLSMYFGSLYYASCTT